MLTAFGNDMDGKETSWKILIACASQFGSTTKVAETIGKVLRKYGATVEIQLIKNVNNVNSYDAIIIGSPIQYDRWRPEAVKFVTDNQDVLSRLPVAYFFTCLVLSKQTAKAKQQAIKYSQKLDSLVSQVKPVSIGGFAGVLDYGRMPFFLCLIAKGIFAILGVKEGDYRDWTAIRLWAEGIPYKMANNQQVFIEKS